MKKELPAWMTTVGIICAALLVVGGIWFMMMRQPKPVDPQTLPPIPAPSAPPPAG